MQFLPIFSSLLISLSLLSTSNANIQGSHQHINHNANARHHSSHARMLEAREVYHANSIPRARNVNGSRKMVKKATKEQLDYQEKFNKMNSEWQAAAQEALKNGQTPQDYNSFSNAHGGVQSGSFSDGSSGSAPSSSSPSSSNDESSDDKSDSSSSEKASEASKPNKSQKAQSQSNSNSGSGSQSDKSDESKQDEDKDEESKPSASTSSQAPKKTPTKSKANGNDDNSNNSGSGILSGLKNIFSGGEGTFFAPGLGSCGGTNSDSDYIVALSSELMDQFSNGNPNTNPLCGKKIKVEYQGKVVEATTTDSCPPCSKYSIDFSPAAFNQLALPEVGRIHGLKWGFVDGTNA